MISSARLLCQNCLFHRSYIYRRYIYQESHRSRQRIGLCRCIIESYEPRCQLPPSWYPGKSCRSPSAAHRMKAIIREIHTGSWWLPPRLLSTYSEIPAYAHNVGQAPRSVLINLPTTGDRQRQTLAP